MGHSWTDRLDLHQLDSCRNILVYTSRYLAKRTMDRLGRGDVQLLRDMAMILRSLKDRDEILPLGVPEELRGEILSALKRYNKTKEVAE